MTLDNRLEQWAARKGGAKLILHLSSPTDRPARPRGPGSDPGPADRPTRSGPAGGDTGGSGVADRPTVPGRRWAEMRGRAGPTDRPSPAVRRAGLEFGVLNLAKDWKTKLFGRRKERSAMVQGKSTLSQPARDGRSEASSLGLLVSVERGAAAMRRCMAAFSALLLIFGVGVLLTPHLDAANTTVLSSVPASSPGARWP